MLLSVFKWLPKKALIRCCLVSRRFNNVAQDESLWGRLDMSCKQIRPGAFANILSRGVVIFRLAQSKVCYMQLLYAKITMINMFFFCTIRSQTPFGVSQILGPILRQNCNIWT